MAMRVNGDLSRLMIESERIWLPLKNIVDELLKKKAAPGYCFGVRQFQFPVIFDEHRVA